MLLCRRRWRRGPGGAEPDRLGGLSQRCVCHASFSTIRKFFRDVLKIRISREQLVKLIGKVTASLAGMYDHLLARLPGEPRLNEDETGHKENQQRQRP